MILSRATQSSTAIAFAFAVGVGLSFNVAAIPANFSFAGTFGDDGDVQLFNITANGTSTVRLISYGYGGGTQANGNGVAAGGLDPILALFDSTGLLVGQNDDAVSVTPGACGSGVVSADPITGRQWDVCLDLLLAAGHYTIAVMEFSNFAVGPNLANGFTIVGDPDFTSDFGCTNGQFCDSSLNPAGNNRTNRWAFDILNVEQAAVPVPEPATLALLGLGLAGLASRRRKLD